MCAMWRISVSVAMLGLLAIVRAGVETQCVISDVCYSLNIPEDTVSSGSGDIYIQISGPTTYSWIGVGQGSQMAGSQIFVIYTDSTLTNVTLSPRLGTGHTMPNYNSAAQVKLLAGSGVSNGVMTANIKCSSCSSWNGGSMDLSSSTTSWIYAFKTGSSLASDSTSQTIQQHDNDGYGTIQFDKTAQGGADANPFLESTSNSTSPDACGSLDTAASTSVASNVTTTPTLTLNGYTVSQTITQAKTKSTASNNSNNNDTKNSNQKTALHTNKARGHVRRTIPLVKRGETAEMVVRRQYSSSCTTNGSGSPSNSTLINNSSSNPDGERNMLVIAHSVMACLAFAFFFPIGGIVIRLSHFPGTLLAHASLQIGAYVMYTAAVGLGIYIALKPNSGELHNKHPIIGLFLFVLLMMQAPAGWMHHVGYKKYGGRTYWSYMHLWIGRIAITLGIINAGFGFMLTGTTGAGPIVYAVAAGINWVTYVLCAVIGENQRRETVKAVISSPRRMSANRNTTKDDDEQNPNSEPRVEVDNARDMEINVSGSIDMIVSRSMEVEPSGLALHSPHHQPHPRHYSIPLLSEGYHWRQNPTSRNKL